MKNLKYFKIFEAFESSKISKTLKFINKSSRETFIQKLKGVAAAIDFPLSELSDDFLQYLPFNKALQLNQNLEDKPCQGKSTDEFGDSYGISGEVCQSGKIKRKWGQGVRNVSCPRCSGTGIEPKTNYPIKWIKFWFDKEGNYIETTATDGKIRSQSLKDGFASQNISDYKVVKKLTLDELMNLPTGQYVKIKLSDGDGVWVIGRTFKRSGGGATYIIQNSCNGSSPGLGGWEKYGSLSWVITSQGDFARDTATLLDPIDSKEPEEPNAYTWNGLLNRNFNGITSETDMKSKLSNAHFAIVLDYLELSNSKYKKKKEIQTGREEQRSGASFLRKPEEIRQENINRYIEELNKRISISPDLSTAQSLIFRYFGLGKFGYYVLRGRHFSDFDSVMTYIYKFLEETGEEQVYYYNRTIELVKSKLKPNIEFSTDSDKYMREHFSKTSDEKKILKSKLEELNTFIYNRFKEYKIETIEDIEAFFAKMKTIREIWRSSDRFPNLRELYYLVENMSDSWRLGRYLEQISEENVPNILKDLERFKVLVSKI